MLALPFYALMKGTVRAPMAAPGWPRRDMAEAEQTIQGAGASGQLLADFRALAEATTADGAPRYALRPVLNRLARAIVGREGGPNRDMPLFELCHLANAVEACGNAPDRQAMFFLSGGRVAASACARQIDLALAEDGWRRQGFTRTVDGIRIDYRDGNFGINFGRMPFLIALYEFLCGMEDYSFYSEFSQIIDEMTVQADNVVAIQQAANAIARRLRRYRGAHLSFTPHNDRFEAIYAFLRERSPELRVRICDDDVLDFWKHHSSGNDFRGYRTVFNAFANFIQALDGAASGAAAEGALRIGTDREEGEVDPTDDAMDFGTHGDWRTPFAVLDEPPAARIKFFKKRGERESIELLMEYGPHAVSLPLAFLRLESFGPVQSAITTDLQVKRGTQSVRRRIACEDSESYVIKQAGFQSALTHVRNLQKATLYALIHATNISPDGNVTLLRAGDPMSLFEAACQGDDNLDIDGEAAARITEEAARAFRALTRKGFTDAALEDDSYLDGFREGAGAVLSIAAQIEAFLDAVERLAGTPPGLDTRHREDQAVFSAQFAKIYGDVL
jgi:hypothetical protein